jgi:hypothetical protein
LTWTDNAKNETGYRVYRSKDGGATWTLIKDNLPANTKKYADNGSFTRGQTIQYYVVAFNGAGASPPSNVVSVVVP